MSGCGSIMYEVSAVAAARRNWYDDLVQTPFENIINSGTYPTKKEANNA